MKSLTKRKSLMGFIYALIMLLPFSAILVRCLYVTFNKNAYLSYSDYNINETIQVHNSSEFIEGQLYQFTYNANTPFDTDWTYYNINYISLTATDLNLTQIQRDSIVIYNLLSPNIIQFRNTNSALVASLTLSYEGIYTFGIEGGISPQLYNRGILTYQRLVSGTLDNAFDYSLYTFLNENGTGRLNLTDWFTDIFLNRTTHNMLYLNYVNWYMNYSLLVSCVYLLYSVLMWFLTFARYVINKPLKESE